MNKLRFGILGISRIAGKAAIPAILNAKHAELAMIGTSSREKAQGFDCPSGSYEDVLRSPDVDAVYISLPNSMHEEWSIKAAKTGKHIWCEKPAALTYASAKKMVHAAEKHAVRLMEGFMYRYHPQHKKVLEIIESGELGEISRFEGRIAYPKPDADNIRLNAKLGGGFYYDALVYPISASRMIFRVEPISATASFKFDHGVDVTNDLRLEYPDGREAVISGGFSEDYASTYKVIGTKGSLWMSRAYAVPKDMEVKIFAEINGQKEDFTFAAYDHFVPMIEEFCDEILHGKTKDYEKELLAQAKVVEAGWRSAQKNATIPL